jgi:predicted transcriptional regulator
LKDIHCDLTQDLFLRLYEKARWQFYLASSYTDEAIDHELYNIEIPNLISQMLRERYPESYRLARRTSVLLQSRDEFRRFVPYSANGGNSAPVHRLGVRVYGLRNWSTDKPAKSDHQIQELVKNVPPRMRDTRRTGRGSGSQIIISNEELARLIVDIFLAIDCPASVRTIRQLVLSRLTIEDSWFISIDTTPDQEMLSDSKALSLELVDDRPTPEQILLEKETMTLADEMAIELLSRMRKAVKNKPRRYKKFVNIVWHCYYDPARLSQTKVASLLGISDSLVSHYRKIYDGIIQSLNVSAEEFLQIQSRFAHRLKEAVAEAQKESKPANCKIPSEANQLYFAPPKPMVAVASSGMGR